MTPPLYFILDQGSSCHKLVVYDENGNVVDSTRADGPELMTGKYGLGLSAAALTAVSDRLISEALDKYRENPINLGLANQGETVLAWKRSTGEALSDCISWQCSGASSIIKELKGQHEIIRLLSGLVPSAYFSAAKISRLLRESREVRAAAEQDDLCLGTLDSWMIYHWTGGKYFVTDPTTACRTQLYDLAKGGWSDELLTLFGVPKTALAKIIPNDALAIPCTHGPFSSRKIMLRASLCDQPAGLIGHGGCIIPTLKVCFGTGAFVDLSLPENTTAPNTAALLKSVLYTKSSAHAQYYLEGGVLAFGSLLEKIKTRYGNPVFENALLNLGSDPQLFCLPAENGLGAPHFRSDVRTLFSAETGDANRTVTAMIQGLVFRVAEIIIAMRKHITLPDRILVDGGISQIKPILQALANAVNIPLGAADHPEITSMGVWQTMMGIENKPVPVEGSHEIIHPQKSLLPDLFKQWQKWVKEMIGN